MLQENDREQRRQSDLERLTEDEFEVYQQASEEFKHGRTYSEQTNEQMRDSLQHGYGMYAVEIYQRPYNERKRNHSRIDGGD